MGTNLRDSNHNEGAKTAQAPVPRGARNALLVDAKRNHATVVRVAGCAAKNVIVTSATTLQLLNPRQLGEAEESGEAGVLMAAADRTTHLQYPHRMNWETGTVTGLRGRTMKKTCGSIGS